MSAQSQPLPEPETPPGARLEDGESLAAARQAAGEGPDGVRGDGPESGESVAGAEGSESDGAVRQARAPWHFKVILVGSVVYLGWRAYQGIGWLAHHIH